MANFRPTISFPAAKSLLLWIVGSRSTARLASALGTRLPFPPKGCTGLTLSVPLVNIRFWLNGLVAASRVTPDDAQTALDELRQLPVFDRDIVSIKKCLHDVFHKGPIQTELETMTAFPDIKRNDARKLLGLLASIQKRRAG
jgi:hypothetical protein